MEVDHSVQAAQHEYRVDPVLSKMPAPNAAEEPPAP
jgi:hypothetical protein